MKWLKKFAHLWLRLWMLAFHRFRSSGDLRKKLLEPTLIIANHASHMDIAAICSALPMEEIPRIRVAAARDAIFTRSWPTVCMVRFLFNAFPFERKGSTDSLRRCAEYIEGGYHVIIFPEGRRSASGDFLGFTHGFASVSYKTGAPVLPLRIDGAERALPRGTVMPLSYPLFVNAGEPIEAERGVPWDRRREVYARLVEKAEEAVAN